MSSSCPLLNQKRATGPGESSIVADWVMRKAMGYLVLLWSCVIWVLKMVGTSIPDKNNRTQVFREGSRK